MVGEMTNSTVMGKGITMSIPYVTCQFWIEPEAPRSEVMQGGASQEGGNKAPLGIPISGLA